MESSKWCSPLRCLYMREAVTKVLNDLSPMKDDMTAYTWIYPSGTADREVVMDELFKCNADFGDMTWIVSDCSAHFTASVMKSLVEALTCVIILQRLLSYSPQFCTTDWSFAVPSPSSRQDMRGTTIIDQTLVLLTGWIASVILKGIPSVQIFLECDLQDSKEG